MKTKILKPAYIHIAALVLALLLPSSLHAASQKFISSGTFTPPAGITNVTVECWGNGGAGGGAQKTTANSGGGGGGGGAYAKKLSIPVTPGTPYTVTIPAAATCPASGFTLGQTYDGAAVTFTGDSAVSVTANGGTGGACAIDNTGAGGAGGAAGVGFDVVWKGGDGKAHSTGNGGPGGGGASDLGAGNDATAGTSTQGAAKVGSDADHNGGRGASGKTGAGSGNTDNTAPGGGGGGGKVTTVTSAAGSAGKKGQIIITYSGATVVKTNNTDDLNLGSSWVGGNTPDFTGIAKWDNTVTSANTAVLGADLAWGGITIADPAGLVTINAGNTLTNGGNIDLSSATADLTLNCGLALGGSAVWNVATNRTLTLGGIVSGSFNVTKQGTGRVILSAANTYSGATAVTGGTLQLGASNVIPNGSGKGDVSVAATCTLDLNSYSDTINGLNGAGIVDNTAAGTSSTLTVGGNNVDSTFSGVMQNSGSSSTNNLVKTGSGQLTLSGPNTFSGTVVVNGGQLNLGTANPLANISGLTLAGGTQLGYQANNAVISVPITLAGNVTVIQNSIGAVQASLNNVIGGTGNMIFATGPATMNGDNRVSLGAASSFAGNVTITTSATTTANNMTVQLGAVNALPPTAVVTLDGQNGNGSSWSDLDMFGFDQTLAGLQNVARTSRLQRVYNTNTAPAATLTISNVVDYTFGGTLGKTGGNNFGLTKSGTGTFTLAANNSYTGPSVVSGGILSLGSVNAMQNSALNTLNSVTGDPANGLQTTVTTLTLGGLTGDKNLASVFTTTSGGYDTVIALTLKPVSGVTNSYSAVIADGVPGMTLTKSGAGTQILTGTQIYTGATAVNAGHLLVNSPGSLNASSAVTVNTNGTLGGNGTIGGSVTVADGGNLSPGASVGTLSIGGGFDVSAQAAGTTGKLIYELGPTSASDKIVVTGTLTIGSGVLGFSDFVFTNAGGLQNGTYTLITSGGLNPGDSLHSADTNGTIGSFNAYLRLNGGNLELIASSAGPSGPATLTNSYSGGVLTLTWPAGQNWRLVNQTNSLSTGLNANSNAWFTAPGGIDGSNSLTINPANPTVFYRLINP